MYSDEKMCEMNHDKIFIIIYAYFVFGIIFAPIDI